MVASFDDPPPDLAMIIITYRETRQISSIPSWHCFSTFAPYERRHWPVGATARIHVSKIGGKPKSDAPEASLPGDPSPFARPMNGAAAPVRTKLA
jgi:hypothetical protein